MIIHAEKLYGNLLIQKVTYFDTQDQCFIASGTMINKSGNECQYNAHGDTLRDAISALTFKMDKNRDVSEHVARIKAKGTMTSNDYRLLTSACESGTNHFLQQNNEPQGKEYTIDFLLERLKGQYGYGTFAKLMS